MDELLKIWEKNYQDISKYFQCLGIWTAINGDINSVYHLYYWKNFKEYEKKKSLFKKDMNEYIEKVKLMYLSQNSIMLKNTKITNDLNIKDFINYE